jgi:hypothetical protein
MLTLEVSYHTRKGGFNGVHTDELKIRLCEVYPDPL